MKKEFDDMYCSFCSKSQVQTKRLIVSPDGTSFICDECIKICGEIMHQEERGKEKSQAVELLTPKQIKEKLDEFVVGQHSAKQVLSVAVYNHYKRINHLLGKPSGKNGNNYVDIDKSNVLLLGPTGSGKTLLAKTLAKILNVPFAQADATTLTETGYIGEDVESVLQKLVQNANYDIKKAERGIVYIDEIDKLARKSENRTMHRDVGGEGVQQALLKIIEGTTSSVPPQGGRKHPYQEMLSIDTTNILFIVGGAFVGISEIIEKRMTGTGLGFGATIKTEKEKQSVNVLKEIQPQDLVSFGLIPEFIGRIPVSVGLDELDENALVDILSKPKNSLVKQFEKMFELDGIELEFTDSGLRAIAQQAIKLKTGARGLRTIIEGIMLDTMFNAPTDKTISKIVVDEAVVSTKSPIVLRQQNLQEELTEDSDDDVGLQEQKPSKKLTIKTLEIQEAV